MSKEKEYMKYERNGFQYQVMDENTSHMFLSICMADIAREKENNTGLQSMYDSLINDKDNIGFGLKIIKQRLDGYKIHLDIGVQLLIFILGDRPGAWMLALIEVLEMCGENATMNDISMRLYPNGFHNEKSAMKHIDYIKANRDKLQYGYLY